jgi:tetratricopeptide (TPR) repeat protein
MAFFLLFSPIGWAADPSTVKDTKRDDPQRNPQEIAAAECLVPGHQALEKGNLKEAIRIFEACAQKYSSSPIVKYWLGMVYFFDHDAQKAAAQFKEVVRLDPENPLGISMLGRVYSFDPEKLSVARELLERAVSLKPDLDEAHFDLGRVYAQQGDYEKSFREFDLLFQAEERYALYRTEFAKVLMSVGKKEEAEKSLHRALAYSPDFEPAKRLLEQLNREKASGLK